MLARFAPLLGLLLVGTGVSLVAGVGYGAAVVGALLWLDAYVPDGGKRR